MSAPRKLGHRCEGCRLMARLPTEGVKCPPHRCPVRSTCMVVMRLKGVKW